MHLYEVNKPAHILYLIDTCAREESAEMNRCHGGHGPTQLTQATEATEATGAQGPRGSQGPRGPSSKFPRTDLGPRTLSNPLPKPPGPLKLRLFGELWLKVCPSFTPATCDVGENVHALLGKVRMALLDDTASGGKHGSSFTNQCQPPSG